MRICHSCPGRPLHLSESDRIVDRAGLGCVERLSVAAISPGSALAAWMLAVVSAAAVLLLAAVAWRQTSYWRNAETVWTRAIACTEQNVMAHYNLALVYVQQGKNRRSDRPAPRSGDGRSRRSADDRPCAMISWRIIRMRKGRSTRQLRNYEEAVRVVPTGERGHASPGDGACSRRPARSSHRRVA